LPPASLLSSFCFFLSRSLPSTELPICPNTHLGVCLTYEEESCIMFFSFSITLSITSYIILKNNFYHDPVSFQPSIIGTDIYYVHTPSLVEALQPPVIPTCERLMLSCLPCPLLLV
jgi:hypothetical protein